MANPTRAVRARKGRHLDGHKFACLKCIRGNRSEQCKPGKHMDDLRWIRPRGRPPGARNNVGPKPGPKPGRKFSSEKFTALSADEVGRVPAEEVLLPVESNQAQVANGQMKGYAPLPSEADLALPQAKPNMFGDEAPPFNWGFTADPLRDYLQLMNQFGDEDIFGSLPRNGQMPANDPPQHIGRPEPQPVFEYPMQWD